MRHFAILTILIVFVVCGCGGRGATNATTGGKTDNSGFVGRLEAAKAIVHATNRDTSLAALAVEAAKAGEGAVAKQCVESIVSATVKDDAGYDAALALARAGKAEDAKLVAVLIIHATRKDKAMAKIAEGG